MRKQLAMERASVVAKTAEKAGPLFVVASTSTEYSPTVALASHGCKHCGTQFAAVADLAPFCVTCGSDDVDSLDQQLQVTMPPTDEQMCYSTCAGCGNHNQVTVAHAQAFNGIMHCSSCGNKMPFEMANDDGEPVLLDDADAGDLDVIEAASKDKTPTVVRSPAKAPKKITTESASEEDGPDLLDDADASELDVIEASPGSTAPAVAPVAEKIENVTAAEEIDLKDESIAPEEMLTNESPDPGADTIQTAALIHVATVDVAGAGEVSLVSGLNKTLAFVNDKHVATLEDAAATPEIATMALGNLEYAINHTAKTEGVKASLKNYGFSLATVSVPVNGLVKAAITAGSKEAVESLAAEQESTKARFIQALSLAATAIQKKIYQHHTNPVKSQLVDNLTAANVGGARQLVESAFSSAGEDYNRALITLASELLEKTDDARNELASLIGGASSQETASQEESLAPFHAAPEKAARKTATASAGIRADVSKLRGTFGVRQV